MIDLCGKYLGEGFRRVVYDHKNNPNWVIKFLKNPDDDHNRIEWENWNRLQDTPQGEWLVPCISITSDSRFLVQQKVDVHEEAPEDVPTWIKDLGDWSFGGNKSKHWGTYNNRIVLIDYGDKPL